MDALQQGVLKHVRADFIVKEVLIATPCEDRKARFEYFYLRKSGFTTMEAVQVLAEAFSLATRDVTYGGLKDEDGITEQLIAIPSGVVDAPWRLDRGLGNYVQIVFHCHSEEPLAIGGLEGNAFRIVVRDLDAGTAQHLASFRKLSFCFLNYYDIQRFGVPGGPRRTHHVGAALLDCRWGDALTELIALRAPESKSAANWQGEPEEFFNQLDERVPSFYLSAHGSAQFNADLRALLRSQQGHETAAVEIEGVAFDYAIKSSTIPALLAQAPQLTYRRYHFGFSSSQRNSTRPTVIQTQIAFDKAAPDAYFPGSYCVSMRLFLPSGCYATSAVRQLLFQANLELGASPGSWSS